MKPQLQSFDLSTVLSDPANCCRSAGSEAHDSAGVLCGAGGAALPVRIVLASRQRLLREGIRELLRIAGEIMVLAEAATAHAAIEISLECCPDILLMDCSFDSSHEMQQIREAAARLSTTRLLLLTDAASQSELTQLISGAVCGVLLKESATAQELLAAIQAVMALEQGNEKPATYAETERRFWPLPFGLTLREMEVLNAVADGLTNRQIALQLSISSQTVKHHLSHIFDKTGVDNRLGLALFAHHHQLLQRVEADCGGMQRRDGAGRISLRERSGGDCSGPDPSCRNRGSSHFDHATSNCSYPTVPAPPSSVGPGVRSSSLYHQTSGSPQGAKSTELNP